MADTHRMVLMADGIVRAVYTDSDGDEYFIVDGERLYIDEPEEADSGVL